MLVRGRFVLAGAPITEPPPTPPYERRDSDAWPGELRRRTSDCRDRVAESRDPLPSRDAQASNDHATSITPLDTDTQQTRRPSGQLGHFRLSITKHGAVHQDILVFLSATTDVRASLEGVDHAPLPHDLDTPRCGASIHLTRNPERGGVPQCNRRVWTGGAPWRNQSIASLIGALAPRSTRADNRHARS